MTILKNPADAGLFIEREDDYSFVFLLYVSQVVVSAERRVIVLFAFSSVM